MDFNLDPVIDETRARLRAFVERELISRDSLPDSLGIGENIREDLLAGLRAKADRESVR